MRKLAPMSCVVVVLLSVTTLSGADATASAVPAPTVQPGTFTGSAFDTCTAPPSASMAAWLASPYRAVGIYFGGDNRACAQAELTAGWVSTQVAAGWHLIPLYVGPQASCTLATHKKKLIHNARAAAQGATAARDAAAKARALGLAAQSTLVYDLEAYRTGDAACRAGVLAFMSAWTARLHDLGYLSGFYSSMGSGVADQVANYAAPGYVRPDYLDFARWDRVATVTDAAIPAGHWWPHRRMKQHAGDHDETWGGVTINIDSNTVDLAPLPGAGPADFDRNGWSDVLARTASSGGLALYPGNGTHVDEHARRRLGDGWKPMDALVRIGDLNRDGYTDVVARVASSGFLYLYPGGRDGRFGTRELLSKNFGELREITAIGDLNSDGYPDLIAAQANGHDLYLYPGAKDARLGTRKVIGDAGWHTMSELTGVGDFNGDGHPDLVGRQSSTGRLFLSPGRAGALGARKEIGAGWNGMRDLIGVGDFDRDGHPDLAAVLKTSGDLMLYRGDGGGLHPGVRLAGDYGDRSPLL